MEYQQHLDNGKELHEYDEELDDYDETDYIGSSKLKKSRERHDLRLNYDSDSSDEDYVKKDAEDEAKVEVAEITEKHEEDEDDMFASDDDNDNGEVQTGSDDLNGKPILKTDIANTHREYDDSDRLDVDDDQEIHNYYNNVENAEHISNFKVAKLREPKMEAFIETEEDLDSANLPEEDEKPVPEDLWVSDFKGEDILKAKRAQEQRKIDLSTKQKPSTATKDLIAQLIENLEPAETPFEALARLNPKKKKNRAKNVNTDEDLRKKNALIITELCEELVNEKHFPDTYDMSREEFLRAYKQETGEDFKQAKQGIKRRMDEDDEENGNSDQSIDFGKKQWEFKWSEYDAVNGPFSSHEMIHWRETYFTNEVLVRKVGETHFIPLDEVVFDKS